MHITKKSPKLHRCKGQLSFLSVLHPFPLLCKLQFSFPLGNHSSLFKWKCTPMPFSTHVQQQQERTRLRPGHSGLGWKCAISPTGVACCKDDGSGGTREYHVKRASLGMKTSQREAMLRGKNFRNWVLITHLEHLDSSSL